MVIRIFQAGDLDEWLRMRRCLWPQILPAEELEEARNWLRRADTIVLVLQRRDSTDLGGFVEAGERAYADGCETSPVAFLEGWYVDPDLRCRGWGKALAEAAADWARAQGYRELASDSLLDEPMSYHAHMASGFVEVERAVRYKRIL